MRGIWFFHRQPPPVPPIPPPPPPPDPPVAGLVFAERLPRSAALLALRHHPITWPGANGDHQGCAYSTGVAEECYGEVTEDGYEQILQGMPTVPEAACALTPDSTFVDIGSGYGRLAMYVRMRTNVSAVVGIERNPCRHERAVRGRRRLEAHAGAAGATLLDGLRLIHSDVRRAALGDATHVFMSVQCWGHELIRTIVTHLVPAAPKLRCMIFSATGARDILTAPLNGERNFSQRSNLDLIDEWGTLDGALERVPTSWTPTEALYVGKRAQTGADGHAAAGHADSHACGRAGHGRGADHDHCRRHARRRRSIRDAPSSIDALMDFAISDRNATRNATGVDALPLGLRVLLGVSIAVLFLLILAMAFFAFTLEV